MENIVPFPSVRAVEPKSRFLNGELLTRREAALYLGLAEKTLAMWKSTGRYQLPVVKLGRLVRYRKSDLDEFITSNVIGK